jgi:hypothetical protein
MKSLLTVEQLSSYLHKSIASIRSDATRNPQSLPPICRLPGTKRLLWRPEDVEHWLATHVEGASFPNALPGLKEQRSRRGRPTKSEQIARRRQHRNASQTGTSFAMTTATSVKGGAR